MLVGLGLVEQRYKAVSEVLVDGATVAEVARLRYARFPYRRTIEDVRLRVPAAR